MVAGWSVTITCCSIMREAEIDGYLRQEVLDKPGKHSKTQSENKSVCELERNNRYLPPLLKALGSVSNTTNQQQGAV